MVAIIDYDAGNIKSVEKALLSLGEEAVVTRERERILSADRIILPGVGSFGEAMNKIRAYELEEVIKEAIADKIPFLGICLGLQLLFQRSEESEGISGLGILEGEIVKIPPKEGLKVPQIGWNSLNYPNKGRLFEGIAENSYVYFVHSYYLKASKESIVTATAEYSRQLHVAVEKDNVFACQFHPEKSSDIGLRILNNFIHIQKEGK
ncbi:MAG: imidazole glycerol phosphate synthase subunit HisH [Clostridiales bacterium]|nr:imidazole glycerol phosphate synthase subunit HisH [Clostridiales bacterium]